MPSVAALGAFMVTGVNPHTRYRGTRAPLSPPTAPPSPMILLRRVVGEALRNRRQEQGRTLREVSGRAQVSLGYLSEVERGQKEASSELLGGICAALDLSLAELLDEVSDEIRRQERVPSISAVPGPVSARVWTRVAA